MIDLLRTRRSIRRYEKKAIDERSVEILKEAMLRSPSSRGIRPWMFIFVDDPEVLERLSRAREHGSSFLKGAALGIVVCGDETMSDVWVEDCSIAAIVAHLTAHSLRFGSCWIQIRNRPHGEGKTAEEYVQELLGIPKNLRVESIISIGFPAERQTFLEELQLDQPALDRLTMLCYKTLGLISFFTVGPDEVRAWTDRQGSSAPQAAGVIHSDFERGFIRAEVMKYQDLVKLGSEQKVREVGRYMQKGRDYVVEDGDIINFLFNV